MNKKRVELHIRTNKSRLRGVSKIENFIEIAKKMKMNAIGITDIKSAQSYIDANKYAKGLKIIYGVEIDGIMILAKNRVGLQNIYKILSLSNLKKIKITTKILEKYRDGILIGSSCVNGEVHIAIKNNKSNEELVEIAKKYDYIEIGEVIKYNNEKECYISSKTIEIGEKAGTLVVAVGIAKFANENDEIYAKVLDWGVISNYPKLWNEDENITREEYLKSTGEMLHSFRYLGEDKAYEVVVENTNIIADMCENIIFNSNKKCMPYIKNSELKLKEISYKKAYEIYSEELPNTVKERLGYELEVIKKAGYESVYLGLYKALKKVKKKGAIISNRGNIGSSYIAFLLGFTNVDPILYNIPFENFLGLNGEKIPNIDLLIEEKYIKSVRKELIKVFNNCNVYRCGKNVNLDKEDINKFIEEYNEEFEYNYLENNIRYQIALQTVKKKDGYKENSLIFLPKNIDIEEFCPIHKEGKIKYTHFDISENVVEFNLLVNKDLELFRKLQKKLNITLNKIDFDEKVLDVCINENWTSSFMQNLLKYCKIKKIDDVIRLDSLSRSSNVWLDNQNRLVENGEVSFDDIICSREDIMLDLIKKGISKNIAYEIMECVGNKNKSKKFEEYKKLMIDNNIPNWYINSCEKIGFICSKTYSIEYIMLKYKLAWFKLNFESEYNKLVKK